MRSSSNDYRHRSQGNGLKTGVIVVAIIAILLAIALVATIVISNNNSDEGLQQQNAAFDAVSDEVPVEEGYAITLDVSAHPNAVLSENVIHVGLGDQVDLLPFATLEGMRFVGWFTAPEGDESAVKIDNNSLDLITPDVDVTLYAHFEERPTSIDYDNPGLPILMYHFFYDPEQGETGEDGNWMNLQTFEEHLIYFTSNNYYYPTWEEVVAYINGEILLPEPSVMLTADDGNESFFRLAAPLVLEYGVKMTSFPILIDMDPSRLTEFDRNQIFLESHSYDMHRAGSDGDGRLLTASYDEIVEDVELGREILGDSLAFCLPYGKTNENAKQAMSDAGVGVALAIINDRAYPLCDPMEVPRLRINDGATVEYLASVAY